MRSGHVHAWRRAADFTAAPRESCGGNGSADSFIGSAGDPFPHLFPEEAALQGGPTQVQRKGTTDDKAVPTQLERRGMAAGNGAGPMQLERKATADDEAVPTQLERRGMAAGNEAGPMQLERKATADDETGGGHWALGPANLLSKQLARFGRRIKGLVERPLGE